MPSLSPAQRRQLKIARLRVANAEKYLEILREELAALEAGLGVPA
jgi:ABC-type transport system involved in cytochrome c biogenesis ATPase subunit